MDLVMPLLLENLFYVEYYPQKTMHIDFMQEQMLPWKLH